MNAMNVFRFALALGLTPVVLGIARRLRLPEARLPFLIGFLAIVTAFGMAAIQPVWGTIGSAETGAQLLAFARSVRHVVFAVGGFGLAWTAWRVRLTVLAESGAHR